MVLPTFPLPIPSGHHMHTDIRHTDTQIYRHTEDTHRQIVPECMLANINFLLVVISYAAVQKYKTLSI